MQAGTCTGSNNLKQLGRPNFTYAEGLMKFGLHLDVLWLHEIVVLLLHAERHTDAAQFYYRLIKVQNMLSWIIIYFSTLSLMSKKF